MNDGACVKSHKIAKQKKTDGTTRPSITRKPTPTAFPVCRKRPPCMMPRALNIKKKRKTKKADGTVRQTTAVLYYYCKPRPERAETTITDVTVIRTKDGPEKNMYPPKFRHHIWCGLLCSPGPREGGRYVLLWHFARGRGGGLYRPCPNLAPGSTKWLENALRRHKKKTVLI